MRVAGRKCPPRCACRAPRLTSAGHGSMAILTLTLVKLYVCLTSASLRSSDFQERGESSLYLEGHRVGSNSMLPDNRLSASCTSQSRRDLLCQASDRALRRHRVWQRRSYRLRSSTLMLSMHVQSLKRESGKVMR